MEKVDIEARVERAKGYFKSGYNCSQSVALSYCDLFGYDQSSIAILSGSFGGGFGRMREVCGAVSGMGFVAGMMHPEIADLENRAAKGANYATVRLFAEAFKAECGSIICRELLGLKDESYEKDHNPSERTAAYYAKRPCAELVGLAARIIGEKINGDE